MLYGMDDHEENFVEYGLIKSKQLNIKKIIIFIMIILACFLLIFGSFYIAFNNLGNNKDENLAVVENEEKDNGKEEKKEEVIVKENEIKSEKENVVNEESTKELTTYTGNHVRIALHDTEKIMTKFVPEPNLDGQNHIKNIYYSDEKQVYLTFDDGPSKSITPQVLDILKEYDVKATFFVLGARVDLYPETLKRIYNEGHYIANHGYSHEYKSIYQNKDTVFQEYVECENSIKAALQNEDYNSYLFRFPGGSSGGRYSRIKAEAREHLNSYGIAYTNWNCLNGDAEGKKTKEDCIAEFISTKGNQNSLIVLMHDANDKTQTVESLPDIIQMLKDEGYTFKTFFDIF